MIDEKKKREHLVAIIRAYLTTAEEILSYLKDNADTRRAKLTCSRSIKSLQQAKVHVGQIKHIEILDYLYSSFIGNSVIAYSVSGKLVLSEKLKEYDTDEGIEELKQLVEEQKQKAIEKEKQRQEQINAVKKAQEEGKKVEMVYDSETKTAKPMIIEEPTSN